MRHKIILILISFFFIFSPSIKAINCEYPEIGLTISYDENSTPTINYDAFSKGEYYVNLLSIVKWGTGSYSTSEIKIDQTLFEKYQGYSCPSSMYVCEYSNSDLSLPSLKTLGYAVANLGTAIPCILGGISDSTCDDIQGEAWSIASINEKKLYIYTQEEYENSDLPEYLGGKLYNTIDDAGDKWFDKCDFGLGLLGDIVGGLCGTVIGGVGEGVIWDTLFEEGISFYYRQATCDIVKYEGPYTPINVNCTQLTQNILKYREAVLNYQECSEDDNSCRLRAISQLNDQEEITKNYCSQILQSYDYTGGQKDCIDECLKLKDTLNEQRKDTDLYDDGTISGECGFSGRLIIWIGNIIKWVKYIIPVIVIVLGILDFIKAIGADKEDEMKKAQKKFIRRIIAAALIFLTPIIIEFVLVKMGFAANGCGIIDL